jgi:NAD(P)-dependent dehydrogenase (short-subunit alcohol dehydrogenase family)
MTVNLSGRVALITGGGGGIGREYAHLFAKLGAKVVVNDLGSAVSGEGLNKLAAEQVVDEIRRAGGQAVADHGSVTDAEAANRMVALAVDTFGKLDIIVNNAGILRDRSFAKMTGEEFEDVIKVHLFGAFHVTRAAWPLMTSQKYGRIVLTTSVAGTAGNFGQVNYGAAKLGLVGMMNCLVPEGQKSNILVNAISPGAKTRMTENLLGEVNKYLRPDLVAPAVAWLSSDLCQQSGMIVSALGGFFARQQYFEGPGVQFDPLNQVDVDMFDKVHHEILTLDGAKPIGPEPLGGLEPRLKAIGRL